MIKVGLDNILNLGFPLDTIEKVEKRGDEKRKLKGLEKQYQLKSDLVCKKIYDEYYICSHQNVPTHIKKYWIETYRRYVASSIQYRFWIFYYKIFKNKF